MASKFLPKQPGEVLVGVNMGDEIRAANRLLKPHGLVLRSRGSYRELGDQTYMRLEELPDAKRKNPP